jgi:hypothetical protein
MRSIAIAMCLVATGGDALAFSRCRLSAEECRIVLDERYRLASIAAYEATIPSNRNPLDQRLFLIERNKNRFLEAISRQSNRIATEMVRLLNCDAIADDEVSGWHSGIKEDCR